MHAPEPPAFCGVRTFLRLPHFDTPKEVDAAIVGLPLDTGTSFRPGARFAPEAIRSASAMLSGYSTFHDIEVTSQLRLVDAGDVSIVPGQAEQSLARIASQLRPWHETGIVPVGIGGDHSVTLGELRAAAKHGPLALVLFDSHPDTWDTYLEQRYTHASPFRRAAEEGLIDPAHSIMLGLRGAPDRGDWQRTRELGFEIVTAAAMHEKGIAELPAHIRERVGERPVFLSFDIDFLDPAYAPGTGTPAVGGFTTAQALALLRALAGIAIIGADVVEVSPPYDVAQITALAAAQVVFELLALVALRP